MKIKKQKNKEELKKCKQKSKKQKLATKETDGITLIALIITIIVMLILVAVTVNVAVNSGLFGNAQSAAQQWNQAQMREQNIGDDVIDITKEYMSVSIKFDTSEVIIKLGETYELKPVITLENIVEQEVTWSSSDTDVATVNNNGIITPVKAGKATITATLNDYNDKFASCEIIVPQNIGWSYKMESGEQTATRLDDEVGKLNLAIAVTDNDTLSNIQIGSSTDDLLGSVSFDYAYYCADCGECSGSGDLSYSTVQNFNSFTTKDWPMGVPFRFPITGVGSFTRSSSSSGDYAFCVSFYGGAKYGHAGHNVYFEIANANCNGIPLYFE